MAWGSDKLIKSSPPHNAFVGTWQLYTGGAGAEVVGTALSAALQPPMPDPDSAFQR